MWLINTIGKNEKVIWHGPINIELLLETISTQHWSLFIIKKNRLICQNKAVVKEKKNERMDLLSGQTKIELERLVVIIANGITEVIFNERRTIPDDANSNLRRLCTIMLELEMKWEWRETHAETPHLGREWLRRRRRRWTIGVADDIQLAIGNSLKDTIKHPAFILEKKQDHTRSNSFDKGSRRERKPKEISAKTLFLCTSTAHKNGPILRKPPTKRRRRRSATLPLAI